jgi:hypothetical protein
MVPNPDYQDGGMSHDMGTRRMEGMDHSKMPGMHMSKPPVAAASPKPRTMDGMNHSKLKGMTPAPTDGGSRGSTVYTCVMHPEVQQLEPGKCPKCGMTLVKKKTATP